MRTSDASTLFVFVSVDSSVIEETESSEPSMPERSSNIVINNMMNNPNATVPAASPNDFIFSLDDIAPPPFLFSMCKF